MIRFSCPHCGRVLRAPSDRAGASVTCPQCSERSQVPPDSLVVASRKRGGKRGDSTRSPSSSSRSWQAAAGAFWQMDGRVKALLLTTGGLGLLFLVLATVVSPPQGEAGGLRAFVDQAGLPVGSILLVASLAVGYGYGTSCPSCKKWWAKEYKEKELTYDEVFLRAPEGDRTLTAQEEDEVTPRDGELYRRVTYETRYACRHCRHTWSATSSEEYKKPAGSRRKTVKRDPS
jgi:hypothetical protein